MLTSLETEPIYPHSSHTSPHSKKKKVWEDNVLLINLVALFEFLPLWNCCKNREVYLTEHDTTSIILSFRSQLKCHSLNTVFRTTQHTPPQSLSNPYPLCCLTIALVAIRHDFASLFIFPPILPPPLEGKPWANRKHDNLCCSPRSWHGISTQYMCVEWNSGSKGTLGPHRNEFALE